MKNTEMVSQQNSNIYVLYNINYRFLAEQGHD